MSNKEILPKIFKEDIKEDIEEKELISEGLLLFGSCKEILRKFGKPKKINIEKYAGGGLIGMHLQPGKRWETPEVEIKDGKNIFRAFIKSGDYEVWGGRLDGKEPVFSEGLNEIFISYAFSNKYSCKVRSLYLSELGKSAFGGIGGKTPTLKELKIHQELVSAIEEKLVETVI